MLAVSGQGAIDKQGSSLPTGSATFTQQACNQNPHTADVINSDLLPSSSVSISHVAVLKSEDGDEAEVREGWVVRMREKVSDEMAERMKKKNLHLGSFGVFGLGMLTINH